MILLNKRLRIINSKYLSIILFYLKCLCFNILKQCYKINNIIYYYYCLSLKNCFIINRNIAL